MTDLEWRKVCMLYFGFIPMTNLPAGSPYLTNFSELTDSEEKIRQHLFTKTNTRVGNSLWLARFLKLFSIPVAAFSLSKFFDLGSNGTYGYGLALLNNLIFTCTSYISHYLYTNSEKRRDEANRMIKVYDDFKTSTDVLTDILNASSTNDVENNKDDFSEMSESEEYRRRANTIPINFSNNDVENNKDESSEMSEGVEDRRRANTISINPSNISSQYKIVSRIVINSLDQALTTKNVKSITNLSNTVVVESSLNMLMALNDFLRKEIIDDKDKDFLCSEEFIKEITAAFSNVIVSSMNQRSPLSNLTKFHLPRHVELKFTPTKEIFASIISTCTTVKEFKKDRDVEKGFEAEDVNDSGSSSTSQTSPKVQSSHYDFEGYYGEYLLNLSKNNLRKKISIAFNYLTERAQEWDLTEKFYKLITMTIASVVLFNPLADDSEIPWYYKYFAATTALFGAAAFYSIYTRVKDFRTSNHETYDKFQEVIRNFYALKLIDHEVGDGNNDKKFVVDPLVTSIENIIIKTMEEINTRKGTDEKNYKKDTKAILIAKLYIALSEVFTEEYNNDNKFAVLDEDVDKIVKSLADHIEPKIGREASSIATCMHPGKYVFKKPTHVESLTDLIYNGVEHGRVAMAV